MVNRHNNFVAVLIINNCQSGWSNKETKERPDKCLFPEWQNLYGLIYKYENS